MHTIQIRNLPEDVYKSVKQAAVDSNRSMTQLVIFAVKEYLKSQSKQNEAISKKQIALDNIIQLKNNEPLFDLNQALSWINEDKK